MTGKRVEIPAVEMAEISAIGALSGTLPYLRDEIRKMQGQIITTTIQDIDRGSLDPEQALYRWFELAAQEKLLKRFETRLRVAQSVGAKNASKLSEAMNG